MTRKPRLQRLSRLFTIDIHFPKLDVAGSNPVSRSIFNKVRTSQKHTLHSPPSSITQPPFGIWATSLRTASNLRDRAVDWEADIINQFRNHAEKTELVGEREVATARLRRRTTMPGWRRTPQAALLG